VAGTIENADERPAKVAGRYSCRRAVQLFGRVVHRSIGTEVDGRDERGESSAGRRAGRQPGTRMDGR